MDVPRSRAGRSLRLTARAMQEWRDATFLVDRFNRPFLRRPACIRPEGLAHPMPGPKAPVMLQHRRKARRAGTFGCSTGAAFKEGLTKLTASLSAFQAFRSIALYTGACRPRHRMYQPFGLKRNFVPLVIAQLRIGLATCVRLSIFLV